MVVQLNRQMDFHRLYTADEFEELDWPSDDNCYELIDGQIIMTPPAGGEHGQIAHRIDHAISAFDPNEKLGETVQATHFRLGVGFAPAPDLAFIKASDLANITKKANSMVPALVVEVWSPSDLDTKNHLERDRRKVRNYQLAGIALIWGINPKERLAEVYHPSEIEPVIKRVGDELDGEEVLPGFKMAVSRLFQ